MTIKADLLLRQSTTHIFYHRLPQKLVAYCLFLPPLPALTFSLGCRIQDTETALKIQIWPITTLVLLGIILVGLPACSTTTKTTPTATPSPSKLPSYTLSTAFDSERGLLLSLLVYAKTFQPGQEISVVIDEQNTLQTANNVTASNSWPLEGLTLGSCGTLNYPFGVAIFQGNYTASNVSSASPLQLYNPSVAYHCPMILGDINAYVFQPSSDMANILSDSNPPFTEKISYQISVTGYWTSGQEPTFGNFTPGVYTVAGGDEWGALAVLHFVVRGDDESPAT